MSLSESHIRPDGEPLPGDIQKVVNWNPSGFQDVNDVGTAVTPIAVPGTDTYVYLTNDGAGPYSNSDYLPSDISEVWDPLTNSFNWAGAGLKLGDMISIRLDLIVTTSSPSQSVSIDLETASGSPSQYDIVFSTATVKSAGANSVNRWNGLYMGNEDTLNFPSKFKIKSDSTATVVVNGWYVKIERY